MAIKVSGTEVISDDKRILNNESLPDIRPSLLLDFANSKTLDPRITFTRGSTATYWDGKTTAKAEENLFTYSEQFDNSNWTKTRATVTANATTAPDGTTTADSILQASGQTSGGYVGLNYTPTVGVEYTLSVYAKANAKNFLIIFGNNRNWFNLSAGTIGTVAPDHTASMTDVGNGWYRCSVTYTPSVTFLAFYVGDSDNSTTVTDSGGIYLWGAQIEQRSSATAYTPTTTAPIVKYQPVLQTAASGEARFDHDPVTGESKGLLIEEARTNLQTYSEAFDNGAWSKVRLETVEANAIIAPDGTLTGDKYIQEDGSSYYGNLNQTVALVSGTTYTSSVYAKAGQYDGIGLFENNVDNTVRTTYFNLENGTFISKPSAHDSYTITDVGNGWYRFSTTFTAAQSDSSLIGFYLYNTSGGAGNGYDGNYVWGAQLEEGSFPTSYIPTSGSTVTRAGDSAEIIEATMLNYINTIEGTFQVDAIYDPDNTRATFAASIGKDSGSYLGVGYSDSSNAYYQPTHGSIIVGGSTQLNGKNRMAMSWDGTSGTVPVYYAMNGYISSVDNGNGGITFLAATPDDIKLTLGYGTFDGANRKCAHISKVAIYPKALSSATLQAMTEA